MSFQLLSCELVENNKIWTIWVSDTYKYFGNIGSGVNCYELIMTMNRACVVYMGAKLCHATRLRHLVGRGHEGASSLFLMVSHNYFDFSSAPIRVSHARGQAKA